jgi:glycosyltransferase involved in cell wall biosynthesis
VSALNASPYRILMVTGIYPTPARPHKGTFIKAWVDALEALGHQVDIIHPDPALPTPIRYISTALQVFLKTLTGRYDIINGHYGLWCLLARLQWTTPVVAAYLGDDLLGTVTPQGGHSKKSLFVVAVSRWLCKHVDAVTVKTEEMKRASRFADAVVIPDGINFELFQPIPREEARRALGWDPDRFYVVFANNPEIPVKNYALAQQAIKRLREKTGLEAELVVANGLPQTEVTRYINASNALILPSVQEGSPNVVKEAMACNVPVVATRVGDVAEVIGRTAGCSVCEHNAESLADGLAKALRHPERTSGREDICHLNHMTIAKDVLALYTRAIRHKEQKRAQRLRVRFFSVEGGKR